MFRLPDGWSEPSVCGDTIRAAGLTLHRAGVSAVAPTGEEVCGSAAGLTPEVAERAWFELAERVATLDAIARGMGELPVSPVPEEWVYARSNGVALHTSWDRACAAAASELVERDRVLRSWIGETIPELVSNPAIPPAEGIEWVTARIPGEGLEVAVVFGFPASSDLPLAQGFGSAPSRDDAIAAATREALQQLAFLWGEPLPADAKGPPSSMLHLDTYQMPSSHPRLRAWLRGAHRAFANPELGQRAKVSEIGFLDLTPAWLPPGWRVARAQCSSMIPLTFGASPWTAHLPLELRIHPIP